MGENYITRNLIVLDLLVPNHSLGDQIKDFEMGEHVALMKI
jgi:hypothetical protein